MAFVLLNITKKTIFKKFFVFYGYRIQRAVVELLFIKEENIPSIRTQAIEMRSFK